MLFSIFMLKNVKIQFSAGMYGIIFNSADGTYYYPHRGDHIDHIEGPIASNIVPMVS